jgi:hypothetical protein
VRLVGQTIGNHLQTIQNREKAQLPVSAPPPDLRSDLDSGTCVGSVA